MIPNNNISVLPFYTDLQKQNHRKDYAFGVVFPLYTPDRKILPFQIMRAHRGNSVTQVLLRDLDGNMVADITSQLNSNGLTVKDYNQYGYDVITYPGKLLITTETPEGRYYIEITDGIETWYSDIFTIVRSMDQFLRIRYKDYNSLVSDSLIIDFSDNFYFDLYLPTQIGRPDYEFEEQVDKREGYQFVEKQISEKSYKFNFIAPEYLLDAMRIIRMMDMVEIYSKGDSYTVDQFLMTPKWQEGGFLASVECEFQCGTVIKKTGRSLPSQNVGDFNNDFNDDFKNS